MESFLIIGLGRFGQAVAEELIALGHDVVAIEQKETVGQQLADRVTHVVIGDAKEEAVLRAVGVRNFDCVVLGMTRVEDSIMITLALKELGAKYVVAKAGSRQHRTALERVGADRVVFPERDMGIRLAQSVSSKGMIDCIELSPEDTIAEMAVPRKWIGHSLNELDIRNKYHVNVLAVRSAGDDTPLLIEPEPGRKFDKQDIIYVIGKQWNTQRLSRI